MIRLLTRSSLDPFLSLRVRMERALRANCSEGAILEVHDAVYAPVKRATAPVYEAIEDAVACTLGAVEQPVQAPGHRQSIATLRELLDRNAKERDLQNALMDSGLLAATSKVVEEVTISPSSDHRGMRMDIVAEATTDAPARIVELKRGSHLLVAHEGLPSERLSHQLHAAIDQLGRYGRRIESDPAIRLDVEQRHGLHLAPVELHLVAGRRLSDPHAYTLLSIAETQATASGSTLQIYTWDGLLAELERLLD